MENSRPRVAVCAVVRNEGRILLGTRVSGHSNGAWGMPGGHLEFGESILEGAKRELLEETGLLFGNCEVRTFTNDLIEENKHYVTFYVVGDLSGGKLENKEPEKCGEWKWFLWDEMPENIYVPIKNLLKQNFNPYD